MSKFQFLRILGSRKAKEDLPMTRFEQFNEMIFESYCKKSIRNAIQKERQKKADRGQLEQPFSVLTDAVLYALATKKDNKDQPEEPCQVFHAQGMNFPIYNANQE